VPEIWDAVTESAVEFQQEDLRLKAALEEVPGDVCCAGDQEGVLHVASCSAAGILHSVLPDVQVVVDERDVPGDGAVQCVDPAPDCETEPVMDSGDARLERIARLKRLIEVGEYRVPGSALARKLMQVMQNLS
jgi:hypothetical protein